MKCNHYQQCGSCQYELDSYQQSLMDKQKQMNDLFKPLHVNPIIGMDNPYGYRHKVTVSFRNKNKKIVAGIYQEDSHKLIAVNNCMLHHPLANEIIKTFVTIANDFGYSAYDEDRHSGQLRHLQLRVSSDDKVLMTIVIGCNQLPGLHNFINKIKDHNPSIVSIVINYNNKNTSMILGEKSRTVLGQGYVIDTMNDLKFSISSSSFYQVNLKQALVCYQLAINGLKLNKNEKLLDAYCGTGTIGLYASQFCKSVEGVDISKSAIINARNNAKLNGITNTKFNALNVDDYVMSTHFDAIVVDPPRSGCSKQFIEALLKNKPKKIAYISCNPLTQTRDLHQLMHCYKVKSITPVDMFPFTKHIESVAILSIHS